MLNFQDILPFIGGSADTRHHEQACDTFQIYIHVNRTTENIKKNFISISTVKMEHNRADKLNNTRCSNDVNIYEACS